jgi:hypothetical protein
MTTAIAVTDEQRLDLVEWLEYRARCMDVAAMEEPLSHIRKIRREDAIKYRSAAQALSALTPHGEEAAATSAPQHHSRGAEDVLAERRRQMEVEDFGFDQDDHYTSGELAWAAVCYLQNAAVAGKIQGLGLLTAEQCDERGRSLPQPEAWPWDAEWWKPAGQRRDLVKAAALIIAEIERLDRANATAGEKN